MRLTISDSPTLVVGRERSRSMPDVREYRIRTAPEIAHAKIGFLSQGPAMKITGIMLIAILSIAGPATAQSLTIPQVNAVRSAKQYLNFSGFSRNGLIHQLSSDAGDGYDIADATVAVDTLNVDWNMQAARSAKQYLSFSGFSCKGLIHQLSSTAGDKYTVEQATYGANQAGVCK